LAVYRSDWEALWFSGKCNDDKVRRHAIEDVITGSWQAVMEVIYEVLCEESEGDEEVIREVVEGFTDLHDLLEYLADGQDEALVKWMADEGIAEVA
jgi:hypothetical protein